MKTAISPDTRTHAYTTVRPDVSELVPESAMTILDVGCSDGSLGKSLARAREGRKVYGVELNEDFALKASAGLDGVLCADVNQLDWETLMPGMNFDCIIFADVLEHLIDPPRHLLAAKSKLTPGGCIVVSLPNIRHVSALFSIFIKGTFPSRDRGIFDSTHLRWYTVGDAKLLIARSGMKIEKLTCNLRVGDQGGGFVNRAVNRFLGPLQQTYLIREFLAYQICFKAIL